MISSINKILLETIYKLLSFECVLVVLETLTSTGVPSLELRTMRLISKTLATFCFHKLKDVRHIWP
jgi:hypothetical protein